ncbi:MAG: succinate dehydrogenase [Nitrososphaerota archaeon]
MNREARIMMFHYITGMVIILAGGIHLYTVFLTAPIEENLRFDNSPFAVINVYRNSVLAWSLEVLLIAVAFHGFNGLRVILLELYQGSRWTKAVNIAIFIAALVVVINGTKTILLAYQIA